MAVSLALGKPKAYLITFSHSFTTSTNETHAAREKPPQFQVLQPPPAPRTPRPTFPPIPPPAVYSAMQEKSKGLSSVMMCSELLRRKPMMLDTALLPKLQVEKSEHWQLELDEDCLKLTSTGWAPGPRNRRRHEHQLQFLVGPGTHPPQDV